MKFEEIPKRMDKGENKIAYGFRYRLRELTNKIGNSSFLGVVITVATPIIITLIVTLLFLIFFLIPLSPTVAGVIVFFLSVLVVFITQTALLWTIYGYIAYISFHQIKYDINRISGIISLVIMSLSIPSLLFIFRLFNFSGLS